MKRTTENPPKKFRIRFAYPWSADADARSDSRYQFLKRAVTQAGGAILQDMQKRRLAEIARLRAVQGDNLAESIFGRLEHTDVLVADITGRNANVMLELGYGLALSRKNEIRHVFLFCETDYSFNLIVKPAPPSDIASSFISYYRNVAAPTANAPIYELLDQSGFAGKLVSVLRGTSDGQENSP